ADGLIEGHKGNSTFDVRSFVAEVSVIDMDAAGAGTGRINVNVLPFPTMEETARPAFIFFANSYTIERPRPVPRRTDIAFVVKNGSKMRERFSGAIPEPVSWTETLA